MTRLVLHVVAVTSDDEPASSIARVAVDEASVVDEEGKEEEAAEEDDEVRIDAEMMVEDGVKGDDEIKDEATGDDAEVEEEEEAKEETQFDAVAVYEVMLMEELAARDETKDAVAQDDVAAKDGVEIKEDTKTDAGADGQDAADKALMVITYVMYMRLFDDHYKLHGCYPDSRVIASLIPRANEAGSTSSAPAAQEAKAISAPAAMQSILRGNEHIADNVHCHVNALSTPAAITLADLSSLDDQILAAAGHTETGTPTKPATAGLEDIEALEEIDLKDYYLREHMAEVKEVAQQVKPQEAGTIPIPAPSARGRGKEVLNVLKLPFNKPKTRLSKKKSQNNEASAYLTEPDTAPATAPVTKRGFFAKFKTKYANLKRKRAMEPVSAAEQIQKAPSRVCSQVADAMLELDPLIPMRSTASKGKCLCALW